MRFNSWLDTLIEEKGIDTDQIFCVEGPNYGTNFIPLECVIEAIKQASKNEQQGIKNMLVSIDFRNGDICQYFQHLAGALAL